MIYCKGLFHFKPEKVWIQVQRTGSSIEQNRKQDSLKEAKKAEFSKQIIFYCIFAPNYETNCTDIYISVRYRDMGAMAQNTLNPMNNRDRFGNQIDPNTQPDNLEDSTNTEIQSLPPKLYMWKLSETLGNRTIIPADTASLNFQSTNLVEGMFGHYNYLGNLGSPRLSRLFFEREESEPTIFMAPFSSFSHVPTRCFSPTATCLTPILPTTKPAAK